MEGSQILSLGHVTLTKPTFGGHFVVHWIVHVMSDVCTNYEVSLFNRSEDIKGVPKFHNWAQDLSHAPSGIKFSSADKVFQVMC